MALVFFASCAFGQTGKDAYTEADLTPGGEQTPALEFRVIQTQIYETNIKDLTATFKEMCKNGGGSFLSIEYCMNVKLKAFKNFYLSTAHIECEVETVDAMHVKLRIRIKGISSGTPAFNKFVYSAVFKDLSDSLGILGIPINVKNAE